MDLDDSCDSSSLSGIPILEDPLGCQIYEGKPGMQAVEDWRNNCTQDQQVKFTNQVLTYNFKKFPYVPPIIARSTSLD